MVKNVYTICHPFHISTLSFLLEGPATYLSRKGFVKHLQVILFIEIMAADIVVFMVTRRLEYLSTRVPPKLSLDNSSTS